ncbi:MAG: MFS transporter [Planctomycetaceae bacterium]|jgi:FSR family fosmidomycin resistance protein-like MFS transporter|nr:MFS transporter [Planctomycetaceae bacterium]
MRFATVAVVLVLTFTHLTNDLFQSFFQAVYPNIKESLSLTFMQIGFITLTFQVTSSICQPLVGLITDKRPLPYLLPFGMFSTFVGVLMFSYAGSFLAVLLAVSFIGFGSAVFHPEASRIVYLVSGNRAGLLQSLFLVGGNVGGSFGALFAAVILANGHHGNSIWLSVLVICTIILLVPVCRWYSRNISKINRSRVEVDASLAKGSSKKFSRGTVVISLFILSMLIFSKYVYLALFRMFYTFYLIERFGVSLRESQVYLFLFLFSAAVGTLVGGPVGDRVGRKYVIWGSILGAAPFAFCLPFVGSLWWTCFLSMVIGFILSSAFSAILIYAQELVPGKIGMIAGLFFGLAFGIAGAASVVLGKIADMYGVNFVFQICSILLLLGLITYFLPNIKQHVNNSQEIK